MEKETSQSVAAARVDFLDLEMEIDREIDSLFVPAVTRAQGTTEGPKAAGETRNFPESRPGPEIQGDEASPGICFDLDAIQAEVDKGIDSLFVPAVEPGRNEEPVRIGNMEIDREIDSLFASALTRAQGTTEGPKAAGETRNFPESRPGPEIQGDEASPGICFDLDAIEAEVDKGIDSLFVPAVEPGRNEEPVRIGGQEYPKTMQGWPPAMDEQSLKGARKVGGPSPGALDGAALRGKYDESPPENAIDSQRHHSHELSKLIEMFNAAYLSLDWEFSRENIRKFLVALNQLEPFAFRYAGAGSVLRILEVILKRLQDRPHAVNSRLVQLIRDSQGLLTHMLLMEGETGPHEKQRLKDLIEGLQELRQRALAVKAEAKSPRAGETAEPPTVCHKPQSPPEARPAPVLSGPDKDSLQEFAELMGKAWGSLSHNLAIIDAQMGRLREIEAVLAGTPALVPIAQRLNGIGRALEDQVGALRDKRGELIERISRIKKPETGRPPGKIETQKSEGGESLAENGAESQKAGEQVRRVIQHLTALDGQTLALPASCVLRVAHSSEKKGLKILKRGYATLADFKPYLRGIRSGVLGGWTKLPGKKLRSCRFELVALDSFNQAAADGQMAVLASDGQKHAIMFAERVDFMGDAGTEAGTPAEGPPCEEVEILSQLLAPGFPPCGRPFRADRLSSASSRADQYYK